MTAGSGGGAPGAPPPTAPGHRRPARKLSVLGRAGLVVGVAFLVAGAGLLLYTGYRVWDPGARGAQRLMTAKLHGQWSQQRGGLRPVTPRVGQPFATIRVPAFGASWQFSIVEGTALAQLATGPGHVTGTGLPGTPGNFAVAAHDITAGNPFLHLGSLRRGDAVIIQTADGTYRYAVSSETVVRYTDTAVLAAVPGRPGAAPTAQYVTLITCTPVTLDFTPWRIVVTGKLVKATPR